MKSPVRRLFSSSTGQSQNSSCIKHFKYIGLYKKWHVVAVILFLCKCEYYCYILLSDLATTPYTRASFSRVVFKHKYRSLVNRGSGHQSLL